MFLSPFDLSDALGITPVELTGGAMWRQSGDGGKCVIAQVMRDPDDNTIVATVVESNPGQNSTVIAVVTATPIDDGFEVTGSDLTGEASEPEDPMSAAAAFRRQLRAIKLSDQPATAS